jgi:hypothetical protein
MLELGSQAEDGRWSRPPESHWKLALSADFKPDEHLLL